MDACGYCLKADGFTERTRKERELKLGRLALLPVVAFVPALIAFQPAAGFADSTQGSGCIAHHPNYIDNTLEVDYTPG